MKQNNIGHLFLDGLILLGGAFAFVMGFDLSLGPLKKGKEADTLITAVMQENVEKVKSAFSGESYGKVAERRKPASLQEYRSQRANKRDEYGRTALMWLAYANYSVDPATPGFWERTASAVGFAPKKDAKPEASKLEKADAKRVPIVPVLLEAGTDVNAKDNDGWTALMWASWSGLSQVADALIEAKTDVNTRDRRGNSALTLAAMRGNVGIVKALLAKGATATEADREAVRKARKEYLRRQARYDEILALIGG